jgi:hypothetical protein
LKWLFRILNVLLRYAEVEGNPTSRKFRHSNFSFKPCFQRNPIGHSVALLLISASMGLPAHLHMMGRP